MLQLVEPYWTETKLKIKHIYIFLICPTIFVNKDWSNEIKEQN